MARKSKKSEWEKSLSLMSLDELYYILSTPDAYEAGYVAHSVIDVSPDDMPVC